MKPKIAVRFAYKDQIKGHIKKLAGVRWSKTHKVFYVKLTHANKRSLYDHPKNKSWKVDYNAFKKSQNS